MKKIFAIALAALTILVAGCNKDGGKDNTPAVDLTELNKAIADCETLVNGATTANFPQSAIDAFKSTIETVKKAAEAAKDQATVDNLLTQLNTAKETFLAAEIGAIPADALAFAIDFESGANEFKTSGKYEWNAKLMAGTDGLPKYVDGHKTGSKGMQFGGVSYIQIADAVASVVETNTFSIAVWVNTPINENNYILSWDKWNSWKFQTQSTNKAFLTVKTTEGENGTYIEHDSNTEIPENEWHHIVVTLDLVNGVETYYIDGESVMVWDKDNEEKLAVKNQTICHAADGIKLLVGIQEENPETSGYFVGKMDDLAFYTIALDGGQVSKLFNDQK
ncbi:MAG: LamG domain-containing protein [Bacteroidales bacterium]|nr:LamG domain-containing protein [Bacteroidales bacterium]